MIAVDTSALVAIANHEPERLAFLNVLAGDDRRMISAVTLLETRIVIFARFGQQGIERFEEWLEVMSLEIVPFDAAQAAAAFAAFSVYGKGVHPAARLNFGDCASYALAKSLGIPLLFKGDDFRNTDIQAAF